MKRKNSKYLLPIEFNNLTIDWNKLYDTLDRESNKSKKLRNPKTSLKEFKKSLESKNYTLLLNRKIKDEKDLVAAMCIAYSWMPTMLEIHGKRRGIKNLVDKLSKLDSIEWYSSAERKLISTLSRVTNNSIVGAVKTLHLVDPDRYPLIDSRVLIGWKNFFNKKINTGIERSLGSSWNLGRNEETLDRLIKKYFYYRWVLIYWSSNLKKGVTIRDIEFRLYLIGDKK